MTIRDAVSLTAAIAAMVAIAPVAPARAAESPCDCPSDVDGDGAIGFPDLLIVLSSWGPCPGCPADVDGDGVVGFPDLLAALSEWGPCVFEYGPVRDDEEAEQIGLEMLGPGGALLLADAIYSRADRDLDLIRAVRPELAGEAHTPAWAPAQIILQKVAGAPTGEYDALNACMQLVEEDNFAFDLWLLTFPGHLNVERLAEIYEALDSVTFAEPNGLVGGQNFWSPVELARGAWRWTVDDGWNDCFDGCDCHRVYVIDVAADGAISIVSITEWGQPWCDFGG
jgi:hypothetical protein